MPSASLYIKRFFVPFFVKMNRDEAYAMIHELNPSLAGKLKTKGILYILPESLQKVLLPRGYANSSSVVQEIHPTLTRETLHVEIPSISTRYLHPSSAHPRHFNTENEPTAASRKTEIISSGGPSKKETTNIDSKILAISDRIPTLRPFISKLLGFRVRKIMQVFSHKWLVGCCAASGLAVLIQLVFSSKARKWSVMGFKLIVFLTSLGALGGSAIGIFLKFLHERTREPASREKERILAESLGGFSPIESRFDRYDRNEKYILFQ
jgi:hypothetical protein